MIYGGGPQINPALSGTVAPAPMVRGGQGMGAVGDLSGIPLQQLGIFAKQDQNPALKALALQEIGKRGAGSGGVGGPLDMTPQSAMPAPALGAVASGAVTTPGQLPAVVPASQTNPAMNAIATGVTAADTAADRIPSFVDQGVPSSGTAANVRPAVLAASSQINPAIAAFNRMNAASIGDMATGEPSSQDKWLAAAKGFGAMAASRQPGLVGAIGEGAGVAADALQAAGQKAQENALAKAGLGQRQQVLDMQIAQEAERKALAQQQLEAVNAAVQGLPPELRAMALAAPSEFFGAQFKAMFDKGNAPQAVQEYQYAVSPQGGGYKGTFQQWVTEKSRAAQQQSDSGFFGNPIPGTDANGKPAILVLGKDGQLHAAATPQGMSVAPPLQWLNTGTAYTPGPKYGGQDTGGAAPVAIDNAGSASQKVQGEAQGVAAAALPSYAAKASTILQQIDELKAAPGLDAATGISSWLDPRNYIAGTDAYAFKQRVKQLSGGAFLQAYNDLRGAGALTEAESQGGRDALVRMDTAQSKEDFLSALDDFGVIVRKGLAVAQQKATAAPIPPGGTASASAPTASAPRSASDLSNDELLKQLGQ